MILHNSQQTTFRNPTGATEHGNTINLQCSTNADWQGAKVTLRLWQNSTGETLIHMQADENGIWHTAQLNTSEMSLEPIWYYFIIEKNDLKTYYGNNSAKLGGLGNTYSDQPESYQITLYKEKYPLPKWFTDGIVYQIFPDRFYKAKSKKTYPTENRVFHENWYNTPLSIKDAATGEKLDLDYFGGNLKGILEKLPYLEELGVSIIYLNPIFEADSNHRYNTADYCKIDSILGTQKDFETLCKKAELFGIKIILDGVFSHTGSNSIYFNKNGQYDELGAYQSTESTYYPWYQFDNHPNEYKSWWGVKTLPNINETNPSYQDFIINKPDSVLKRWIKAGAYGWRLDVADELPLEFIQNFYHTLKQREPESILIGEVWEDATNKISYGDLRNYLDGNTLDTVMNYPLRSIMIDFVSNKTTAEECAKSLLSLYENYPEHKFYAMMNLIGSHDRARILSILGDRLQGDAQALPLNEQSYQTAFKRLKLITLWQMTFPGVPCVYYGDEAGLEGGKDPFNRACYPWEQEDQNILAWYKSIISLRKTYSALCAGKWEIIHSTNNVLAILRTDEEDSILVLLNADTNACDLQFDINCKSLEDLLTENNIIAVEDNKLKITLEGIEGRIFILK